MRPVRGLARALLGGFFIAAGGKALLNPDKHAPHAEGVAEFVAPMLKQVSPALPTEAATLVRINGAVQLTAGVLLATGLAPRPSAAVLAGTLLPATLVEHPFWKIQDPAERKLEQVQFAKNLGLLGGLLLAAVDTAGSPSVGWRTRRAIRDAQKSIEHAKKRAVEQLHSMPSPRPDK